MENLDDVMTRLARLEAAQKEHRTHWEVFEALMGSLFLMLDLQVLRRLRQDYHDATSIALARTAPAQQAHHRWESMTFALDQAILRKEGAVRPKPAE